MNVRLKNLSKIFNTVKYLRFEQVFYRLYYRFYKPNVTSGCCPRNAGWRWQGPVLNRQSMFTKEKVNFLNRQGMITQASDWNANRYVKLWLYNLHYFDDLNSTSFENRKEVHFDFINRWIDENPPCFGNGWEPYPLSLRLVNWVKWFSKQDAVEQKHLNSISQQAEALSQQLEYHILGNHLFANAKALTFVGCFLKGNMADRYLNLGLKLLDREIPEQFLSDGAHFELSTMYHEILLWDLLELIGLAQTTKNDKLLERLSKWTKVASKSLCWLSTMTHSDGEVSFFNDSAIGIAAKPKQIFDYAQQLGLSWNSSNEILTTHPESGYSRVSYNDYSLIFDHANVGPDYLPGHAHADTLSFEMSIGEQRVFVNSGTSMYGVSDERLRQRQTAAHNTVEVEGLSSSQVWSGFRVAKRAYAKLEQVDQENSVVRLVASHDGYMKLSPKLTHRRTLECSSENITIIDELTKPAEACFHLHLHPLVEIIQRGDSEIELNVEGKLLCTLQATEDLIIEDSTWHPEFGKSIDNKKIKIKFNSDKLQTNIKLFKGM